METTYFLAESKESTVRCDCAMASWFTATGGYRRILKSAVLIGPHQKVKAIFAALCNKGWTYEVAGDKVEKCDASYRVQYEHLPGRWAIAHIRSLDPCVLWVDSDEGMLQLLTGQRYETPLLPEWVPAIAAELRRAGLVQSLDGYSPRGLHCKATSVQLDQIVTRGVAAGILTFPEGPGTEPLEKMPLEKYIGEFALELGDKVSDRMKAIHDPEKDPIHPDLAKLPKPLYAKQAHGVTAAVKVLKAKDFYFFAWNMGTGKTPASILAAILANDGAPCRVCVACPPHLVEKWAREVQMWGRAWKAAAVIVRDWKHFIAIAEEGHVPKVPTFYILAMTKAKLSFVRRASIVETYQLMKIESTGKTQRVKVMRCPDCGNPAITKSGTPILEKGDLERRWLSCPHKVCRRCRTSHGTEADLCADCSKPIQACGAPYWQATESRHAKPKVSPAEYGRKRLRGYFDVFIRDEAHGSKGAETLDSYACSALQQMARRSILMTGTMLAGKAEDLRPMLFKSLPWLFVDRGFGWKDALSFSEQYGRIDTIVSETHSRTSRRQGKGTDRSTRREVRPGIMPAIFGHFCAEHTGFLSLAELSEYMPPYNEQMCRVAMLPEMASIYEKMQKKFAEAFQDFYRNERALAMKLLGPMLETLLTWPDRPQGFAPINVEDENGRKIHILTPPDFILPDGQLLPKEQALLDEVEADRKAARKPWIYCVRTKVRDRLEPLLRQHGMRVCHLAADIEPLKREAWIRKHAPQCDVGLCHPELVETGLELFDPHGGTFNFPTLLWYSTGYKLNTLRQASMRVWRIGQPRACTTKFLYYGGTAQQEAIALMGLKLVHAEALEGKFSDGAGLASEAAEGSLALAIAKNLAQGITTTLQEKAPPKILHAVTDYNELLSRASQLKALLV